MNISQFLKPLKREDFKIVKETSLFFFPQDIKKGICPKCGFKLYYNLDKTTLRCKSKKCSQFFMRVDSK